jgi:hypothetical protein
MDLDFNYDLEEIVSSGSRFISLRTAVEDYIRARKATPAGHILQPIMWNREAGLEPVFFDDEHITALARLPEFLSVSQDD